MTISQQAGPAGSFVLQPHQTKVYEEYSMMFTAQ
jgi:hypothetical protein